MAGISNAKNATSQYRPTTKMKGNSIHAPQYGGNTIPISGMTFPFNHWSGLHRYPGHLSCT